MTAAFWLTTGQTVVFVAGTLFAYWVAVRIAHLLDAADHISAHTEAGAQRATRAALDARQMLDVLTEFWEQLRAEDQATTQPQPVVGPETVPEAQAVRLIDDVDLAWEVARLEQIMRGDTATEPRRSRA